MMVSGNVRLQPLPLNLKTHWPPNLQDSLLEVKTKIKWFFFYSTSHSFILYCRISCFSPEEMNVPYVTNGPNPILESNSCVFFAICCKLQNHRFQYVFAGKISEMLQRIYIWDFPIINSNFPRNICKCYFEQFQFIFQNHQNPSP